MVRSVEGSGREWDGITFVMVDVGWDRGVTSSPSDSPMSTSSGLRWGIPLRGGGGGPVRTGVVGSLSSKSLSDAE